MLRNFAASLFLPEAASARASHDDFIAVRDGSARVSSAENLYRRYAAQGARYGAERLPPAVKSCAMPEAGTVVSRMALIERAVC